MSSDTPPRTRWWHRVGRPLRFLLVVYLFTVLAMTFFETALVYPAPTRTDGDWTAAHIPHEDVQFASADGTQLHGWLFAHPAPKYYIVYFHGNGEHVAYNAGLMDQLRRELAATVFIFDYRGYGKSQGSPHEAGVIADGRAAVDWLAQRTGQPVSNIVLMGRSLGGGVAIALAAERSPQAVIVQSTFACMTDSAARLYPWLPVRWLMQNRYDSVERIQKYAGPFLQSHGDADRIVELADAQRLFAAVPTTNKRFLTWPGRGHNDAEPATYYDTLRAFLESVRTAGS